MIILSPLRPPRHQSTLAGLAVGLLAHAFGVFSLMLVYWFLRPFVWAAIYAEPYKGQTGPFPSESGEWLFLQGISFCASVAAGYAAAHWSPRGSKRTLISLVAINFFGLFFVDFPLNASIARNTLLAFHFPVGVLIGSIFYARASVQHLATPGKTHTRDFVSFDEEEVVRTMPNGAQERVRWSDLSEVYIVTSDEGPFVDDVCWVLRGTTSGCLVPSEADGMEELLRRLQQLPLFNDEAVIKAMGCTSNATFPCWSRNAAFDSAIARP